MASPTNPHFTEPTESDDSANNRVCALIDGDYLFQPTVPAHFTISLQAAIRIEAMLKHGTGLWLRQAAPLRRAIDSDNEADIIKVFYHLQDPVCETAGFTPAT